MGQKHFAGAAVSTPLTPDLGINHRQLVAHTTDLLARGIDLLTLFGTTGEGASFTVSERQAAIAACHSACIPSSQLGTGIFALTADDAGNQARAAFDGGCGHVLMAPPSYYKGIDDDGLYAWFSAAIEAIGPNPADVVLYHIPSFTQAPLSVELVKRWPLPSLAWWLASRTVPAICRIPNGRLKSAVILIFSLAMRGN